MKRVLITVALLVTLLAAKSQVLINLQIPPAGLNIKSQLWNMSLVNTGSTLQQVRLEMILSDAATGQPILSGTSNYFYLSVGASQVLMNSLVPIQYNVLNGSYNIDANPDGFLPPGVYSVCFSVMKLDGESLDKVAEECDAIEIEPAAPPFLIDPADESVADQDHPLFTWLPPTPVMLYSSLTYEFKLVEVINNQNTSDAIRDNFPVYTQSYIPSPLLQYPYSRPALDTGKLYAWQVNAFNNASPAGTSEIFSFRLNTTKDISPSADKMYVKLKDPEEMPFTVCTGVLRYEYINNGIADKLYLTLTDVTSNRNLPVNFPENEMDLEAGQNFLVLHLSEINAIKNGHIYQFVVWTKTGDRKAIRILYKNEN